MILSKYTFRTNNFSFERVVDDAIEDQKLSFLVIGKNNCLFGMSKNFYNECREDIGKFSIENSYTVSYNNLTGKFVTEPSANYEHPYWLHIFSKEDIRKVIKFSNKLKRLDEERKRKLSDNIGPNKKTKEKSTQFTVITL